MSAASQANLLQAAQVASAIAASLAASPGATMTASGAADMLGTMLTAVGPALSLDPKLTLPVALAGVLLKAYEAATATGAGLTAQQWALLVGADDAAVAADAAAHPAAAVPAPTPAV